MRPTRVRHHTNDAGLEKIRKCGAITSSRGWANVDTGVSVEVEPFQTNRPGRIGQPGPKAELGCAGEGAYVEFDAPPNLVMTYNVGPRHTGIIPLAPDQCVALAGLNPVFVKVRLQWWQWWRQRPE